MKLIKLFNVPVAFILSFILYVLSSAGHILGVNPAQSVPLKSNSLELSSFTSLGNDVCKTLYEKIPGKESKITVTGTYDLNNDGKSDNISLSLASCEDSGKSVLKVNGSTITTDSFFALSGVYVVDLNHNDKVKELAICDYQMDDDVYTFFYRYDNGLKLIGEIYGGLTENVGEGYPTRATYNNAIQTNGEGLLIPRLGIMAYTAPEIITSVYQYKNNAFKTVNLDMSEVYQDDYKLSMNIEAYFEEMTSAPASFESNFDQSDVITLQKGASVRFHKISNSLEDSYSSFVTLPNGKTGMLYFFMHP